MSRFTSVVSVAGLLVTGALGAQETAAPDRQWQMSGGLGLGNTSVAASAPEPGSSNKSIGGRIQVGVGVNPWVVVGADVLWSNISDAIRPLPAPGGRDAFMSAALIAKLYPLRRGPFIEIGAGYAQGERGSGYSVVSARGLGVRHGAGVDIAAGGNGAWAVTMYAAGLLMVQPEASENYYGPACLGAGSICTDLVVRTSTLDDVAGYGSARTNSVNVLHFGIALTYAGYSTPKANP